MADHQIPQKPLGAYVYAISVDGVVRYIGKGTGYRFTQHLRRVRRMALCPTSATQPRVHRFTRKLLSAFLAGQEIEARIIHNALSEREAYAREREEIASNPVGQLWNTDLGGHGPTSEAMKVALAGPLIRIRISEGTKRGLADPEVRERRRLSQIEAFRTPEARARKSAATKAKWADPEYRSKVISRQALPEVRAKMSTAAKARGCGFSSESSKALWSDEERVAAVSAKRKALWLDPEYRARTMAAQRAAMSDPDFRARMSAIAKARHSKKVDGSA